MSKVTAEYKVSHIEEVDISKPGTRVIVEDTLHVLRLQEQPSSTQNLQKPVQKNSQPAQSFSE